MRATYERVFRSMRGEGFGSETYAAVSVNGIYVRPEQTPHDTQRVCSLTAEIWTRLRILPRAARCNEVGVPILCW